MNKILILLLFITTGLFAQNERHEKIKALKVAFITDRLDLTSAEAEKFWPVYNSFDDKMDALRRQEREEILMKFRDGMDAMSDAEADKLIDKSIVFREEELANRKQLITDLRKVISSKKIIRLRKTEEDFKKKLLQRMRQQRNKN